MRIAYLNTKYPSLSHTFIEREVRAVRAAGVQVETFSIRPPGKWDTLGDANRAAAQETYYILGSYTRLLMGLVRALFTSPLRLVRAVIASQRLSPAGLRARFSHLAYTAEGVDLAQEMRRRDLRHIHVHMANNGAAVALLTCVFDPRISYSMTIHGSAEFFNVGLVRLGRKVEPAMFVRCISHFCRAQVMAWAPPDSWQRTHVVHCGVDIGEFAPRPPLAEGPLRIITVGRFEPIKGYPLLLQACRQLTDQKVPWSLEMVGDGPMRPILEEMSRKLGISDNVNFTGALGQEVLRTRLEQADVMVISSFMEGVPVVLMEAMAKQLAVVATKVGGIPELIQHGETGMLVTPAHPEELADALRHLALNRDLLARVGPAARQKIVGEFDLAEVGREMARIFRMRLSPAVSQEASHPAAAVGQPRPDASASS